jgi:hypothetical protein
MLGLVNMAHAAPTELVENAILINRVKHLAASKEPFRLEARQQPFLNEGSGQELGAGSIRETVGNRCQLLIIEQPALANVRQKGLSVYGLRLRHCNRPGRGEIRFLLSESGKVARLGALPRGL